MALEDPGCDDAVQALVDRADAAIRSGDGAAAIDLVTEAAQRLAVDNQVPRAIELCVQYRAFGSAAALAEADEDHTAAAQLWFQAGDLPKSADNRLKAGAPIVAAELFERAGAHQQAAEIFEHEEDWARASILWEQAGEGAKAADLLWRAVSDEDHQQIVGPEAVEACRHAADLFFAAGRIDEVVQVLTFSGQPVYAGKLLARAGRHEDALKMLVEAGDYLAAAQVAKQCGDEHRAQLLLAERAENEGRLAEAASHHEMVGEWAAAARLYEFAGDLPRSARAHERASNFEMAGRIWERLGDGDAAARCYRAGGKEAEAAVLEANQLLDDSALDALVAEGRHVEAAQAALTQARRGDKERYAQVETYLGRVPSGHPEHHLARAMLAEVLEEQGEPKRALNVLQRLLAGAKARPDHVPAFYQYGTLLEHEGFLAGARDAYRTAATFDPSYRDVSQRWARLKGADVSQDDLHTGDSQPIVPAGPPSPTMALFDAALNAMTETPSAEVTPPPLFEEAGGGFSEVTCFADLLPPGPEQAAGLVGDAPASTPEEVTAEGPAYAPNVLKAESLMGRVLRGRFRIEKKLGRGSQAQVYLARDQVLDRKVAIKVLSESVADDSTALDRFLREARLAARVHHSGCLAIFDFGQEAGLTFMAMEYFRGRTLRDLIKKGPLDPYLALRLARDVAAALGAVHSAGIIHRDVKPTNVMVDRTGRVRITDFGVARTLDDDHSGGVMVGTMKYMAPEQARAKVVDARADIFSLGVVMYEMLNGKPPFGGTLDALIARVTKPPPPLPSTVNASEEVRRIVRRCMAKAPKQRYQDPDALIEDLSSEISKLKTKRRARRRISDEAERPEVEASDVSQAVAPAAPEADSQDLEIQRQFAEDEDFEHELHSDPEPSTVLPGPPTDGPPVGLPSVSTPEPEPEPEPEPDFDVDVDVDVDLEAEDGLQDDESVPLYPRLPPPMVKPQPDLREELAVEAIADQFGPRPGTEAPDEQVAHMIPPAITNTRPPTDDLVLPGAIAAARSPSNLGR